MTTLLTSGLGDTTGDLLATCKPLHLSGNVWYVSSANGVNAGGNAGQDRTKPLATIAQAITNASDDDIIECLSGHTETFTAQQTVAKRLTIVGGGQSGGKPTVKFGMNNAGNAKMFYVTGTNVEFRNIWFLGNSQTNTAARIDVQAQMFRIVGCYTECGAFDQGAGLNLHSEATYARIVNSTFISTGTSLTAQPLVGVAVGGNSDLEIDGLILSDGTVGFSQYWAFYSSTDLNQFKAINVSLLLGADMKIGAGGTNGYINIQTSSSGARLDW